jgi:hypothetical protein
MGYRKYKNIYKMRLKTIELLWTNNFIVSKLTAGLDRNEINIDHWPLDQITTESTLTAKFYFPRKQPKG